MYICVFVCVFKHSVHSVIIHVSVILIRENVCMYVSVFIHKFYDGSCLFSVILVKKKIKFTFTILLVDTNTPPTQPTNASFLNDLQVNEAH